MVVVEQQNQRQLHKRVGWGEVAAPVLVLGLGLVLAPVPVPVMKVTWPVTSWLLPSKEVRRRSVTVMTSTGGVMPRVVSLAQ